MPGVGAAVRVRVPATSANLGPGFDTFGLALGIHDEVSVEITDAGLVVEVEGEGEHDVPLDERHLVVSTVLSGLRRWHREPPGLRVRCRNAIPHSRGLGSSAAAIVAGLAAARGLLSETRAGDPVPDDELLRVATEIEGHPDNVAAALAGGLTLAWSDRDQVSSVRLRPHDDVLPLVCVPGWAMSTETARGLLPPTVAHSDAVFNAARSGLLVAAATQRPDLLFAATEDRLHQPYRAPAMAPTATLLGELRAAGMPAVISGAGPTVLTLCDRRVLGRADVAAVVNGTAGDWQVWSPGIDLEGTMVRRAGANGR